MNRWKKFASYHKYY